MDNNSEIIGSDLVKKSNWQQCERPSKSSKELEELGGGIMQKDVKGKMISKVNTNDYDSDFNLENKNLENSSVYMVGTKLRLVGNRVTKEIIDIMWKDNDSKLFCDCKSLLMHLFKHKYGWVFANPVDVVGLQLFDYHTVIKHPMDLGTINENLNSKSYKSPLEFAEDVRLTFNNAMLYNPKGQDVHAMAAILMKIFEHKWARIEKEFGFGKIYQGDNHASNSSEQGCPNRSNVLKKPNAKDPNKRKMSQEEMITLCESLDSLPQEKLYWVLNIIKRRNQQLDETDDSVIVDINLFDEETLWELDRYVTNYKICQVDNHASNSLQEGQPNRSYVLKKPKPKHPNKRKMSQEEMITLCESLDSMPQDKLYWALNIIKRRNQQLDETDDSVIVDINLFDEETLWELDRYVTNCKKRLSKRKRNAKAGDQDRSQIGHTNKSQDQE